MHYLDQCCVGAESTKPAQLLSMNLSTMTANITTLAAGGVCKHASHSKVLRGKRENGQYRTAAAKVYPPKMCELLAKSMHDFLKLHFAQTNLTGHAQIQNIEFSQFYIPLDPYFEFQQQHDCARACTEEREPKPKLQAPRSIGFIAEQLHQPSSQQRSGYRLPNNEPNIGLLSASEP